MSLRWRILISFGGALVLIWTSFVVVLFLDPIFGPGLWLANRVLGRAAADGLWLSLGIGIDVVLWSGVIWLLLGVVAMGRRARVA
jgi:hypothetical protein